MLCNNRNRSNACRQQTKRTAGEKIRSDVRNKTADEVVPLPNEMIYVLQWTSVCIQMTRVSRPDAFISNEHKNTLSLFGEIFAQVARLRRPPLWLRAVMVAALFHLPLFTTSSCPYNPYPSIRLPDTSQPISKLKLKLPPHPRCTDRFAYNLSRLLFIFFHITEPEFFHNDIIQKNNQMLFF